MALAVLVALVPGGRPAQVALALAGVAGFGLHMAWQMRRLDIRDPARCLVLFRSNRDAGLIAALFLAAAALA
jgi:4-hydroxybenzoate polyprenyltransferase